MIDYKGILEDYARLRRISKAKAALLRSGSRLSGMLNDPRRGATAAEKLEEIKRGIGQLEDETLDTEKALREKQLEIRQRIEQMDDWQAKKAIICRYLEGKSVHETMDCIGYSETQVRRFINQGKAEINSPAAE